MSTPYGVAALTGELERLASAETGTRNGHLYQSAQRIAQLVAGNQLDNDAFQQLADTARQIGLSPSEITKTISSAQGSDAARNAREPEAGTFAQPSHGNGTAPNVAAATTAFEAADYSDLYMVRSQLETLPEPEPWITGVLDKRTLFTITGRDRSYKSFIGLDWLACLATGVPWQGHRVEPAKVLYVAGEGAFGLHERLKAWEAHRAVKIPDDRFHIRRGSVNLFKRAGEYVDLASRARGEGYDVILLDTLQRMSAGAETNSAKDAGVIVESMAGLRNASANGTSVGIVAHTGKGDTDTRGSSAFEDDLDIVWRIKRNDDAGSVIANLAKRKDGPEDANHELVPRGITGTGSIVLVRPTETISAAHPKLSEPILLTLTEPTGADGLAFSRIKAIVEGSDGSVSRALNWLIEAGYVTSSGQGKGKTYRATHSGLLRIQETRADQ
jgi:DNA-binding transcriptional ArsR family regulator